eukprot:GEMP01102935.1.p1 GENE.GEMP01102935.1~~GEMP01102935.1.p1  ORF type:complete len:105 (+),score=3.15 GEMP01102935.1:377-691(+)
MDTASMIFCFFVVVAFEPVTLSGGREAKKHDASPSRQDRTHLSTKHTICFLIFFHISHALLRALPQRKSCDALCPCEKIGMALTAARIHSLIVFPFTTSQEKPL